ncbi:uncharacterized protein [Montipora capricornis]|uniref:uncharacterized protein isoform X2 n=1 Tax=Montipora capricornis TaxID=246305 RepID=UPI0035F14C0E
MMLLRDFGIDRELSEKATPQQPHVPSAETLPMAPLLEVEKVRKAHGCNCSTFPLTSDVFVNLEREEESQVDGDSYESEIDSKEQFSDGEWHSSHESSDEGISDDETTHTLAFKCIGAAHEKERQEFLKIASQKSKERQLQVKLRPEPTNEKDINAIAIDVNHGSGFFHCGYIASRTLSALMMLIEPPLLHP